MELTEKRYGESLDAADANTPHAQSLSQVLADSLKGVANDLGALSRFSHLAKPPWGLIVMMRKKPPFQADQILTGALKRAMVQYVSTSVDDMEAAFLAYEDISPLITEFLKKENAHKIAYSLPFDNLDSLPRQYELLTFCLKESTGRDIISAQTVVLNYLKSQFLGNVCVDGLLHPALAKLARYDNQNQSDMLETLRVYLDNDRNAQRCANLLYLHRNSLQYRVRRIQEITGVDLDDANERAYLRLSLLLSS